MKNPMDVLRSKEQELLQVRREIEALRIALPLLGDEGDSVSPISAASKSVPRVMQLP